MREAQKFFQQTKFVRTSTICLMQKSDNKFVNNLSLGMKVLEVYILTQNP